MVLGTPDSSPVDPHCSYLLLWTSFVSDLGLAHYTFPCTCPMDLFVSKFALSMGGLCGIWESAPAVPMAHSHSQRTAAQARARSPSLPREGGQRVEAEHLLGRGSIDTTQVGVGA